MKRYGLIGYPLGHSLSPFIHKEILKRTGHNGDYSLYEIPPNEFLNQYEFLDLLHGFNVTIPHKEGIIPYCEKLDESAKFGFGSAVNCVKNKIGYNTDVFGFLKCVEALGANLNSRVCLLGYGGAGKMVAHCVEKAGGELTIIRRGDMPKGEFDLLVNSTPVGMFPKIDETPINFENINAKYVLDLIYNPAKTKLMSLAEQKGAISMNGLIMLVWQAIKAHEIWYNGSVTASQADEIIRAAGELL